jgi:hypothetical protein
MRRLALLLIASLVLAGYPLSGKVIGRRTNLDQVLQMLERPLHDRGIDVVAGNTASFNLGSRPRVATLSGMPTANPPPDWSLRRSRPWMEDFRDGLAGFVAGAKSTHGRRATSADDFLNAWHGAPRDRRVFISFTAKDVSAAEAAADALAAKGYVAFVFIKSSSLNPTYDTALVGRMFGEAGHHYVVDTPNARKSAGVWFEASLVKHFKGPDKGGGGGNGPAPKPRPPTPVDSWAGRETFLRKIDTWVVTQNPDVPGKLFIHRRQTGLMLEDLLYTVRVRSDGSWVVYDAYGSRLGKISIPPDVRIGECGCT